MENETPFKRILMIVGSTALIIGLMVIHQLGKTSVPENKPQIVRAENRSILGPVYTPPENKPLPPKDLIPVRMQKRSPSLSVPTPDGTKLLLAFEAQNIYDYPLWIEDMELVWRVRGHDVQIPGTREMAVTSVFQGEIQKHPFLSDLPRFMGTTLRFPQPIVVPPSTNLRIQLWGRKDPELNAFIQQNMGGVHLLVSHIGIRDEGRKRRFHAVVLSLMSDPIY